MNAIRKILFLIAAIAMTAFSVPALAHYVTLEMAAGAPGTLTAKITNKTSFGNYTINSIKIPFGTNVGSVASAAVTAYTGTGSTSGVTVSGGHILVPNVSLAYNKSITLTLSGVTPSSSSCAVTSTKWSVKAYESSNYNGFQYVLSSSGSNLTVNLTPACYTVTFDKNGGTGTMASQTSNVAANLTANAFSRPGYTFAGWNTVVGGSGTSYANQASYPFTASATLYAQWTANIYTVSFNSNGGSAVAPQNVAYGATATAPADPTKTGYTFAGWFSDAGLTTAYVFSTPITGSITLYAKWTTNVYTVTFDTNGGSSVASQNVPYGQQATAPADPTKALNTFAGWFSDAGLSMPFAFTTLITANTTVYAKWIINSSAFALPPASATSAFVGPNATTGPTFSMKVVLVPPPSPATPVTLTAIVPVGAPDGTTCPALAGGSSVTVADGSATFAGLTFTGLAGTCTLTAHVAGNKYPDAIVTPFVVYASGDLACGDPSTPTTSSTFDGSATTGLTISDPGFALGVRGYNIAKLGAPDCANVNWTFTNNVLGTVPTLDAKGNTIPANSVSFVWDQSLQPNAAYSYTVTWSPEWFGLASTSNRKTQFCAGVAPNACATIVTAQACTSPALLPSSIPGTDPACVSAEVWGVVSSGMCAGLPAPAADQNACVVFTSTITDIKDPPIIRN